MKAKRIFAALLAAAALCLLAGCGRNTYSTAAAAAANAAQSRITFDTSPRLDRALRAVASAGDADAVRAALIERLGLEAPDVLQEAGQSSIYLYILSGSMDVPTAAARAATELASQLAGLPVGGRYDGAAAMIEYGGSYYIVFVVTVVEPGSAGSGSEEPKVPAEIVSDDIKDWNDGGTIDVEANQ